MAQQQRTAQLGMRIRHALWLALTLGLGLPLLSWLIHQVTLGVNFSHVPLHALLETLGLFAGLLLAGLLLLRRHYSAETGDHLWVAYGLLAMGIFDGWHAASMPGQAFVWLHSVAVFTGGGLFALVWLPRGRKRWINQLPLAAWVAACSVVVGAVAYLWPASLPEMVVAGVFTRTAVLLNVLGGLGFLAAAGWFVRRLARNGSAEDYAFLSLALLFGMAALLFVTSKLWDVNWWLWHGLRLVGYLIALGVVCWTYQQDQVQLQQLNEHLEESVSQRVAALQDSEQYLRTILSTMLDGVLTIDAAGVIQSLNPATEQIFGYSSNELLGHNIAVLMAEPDAQQRDEYLHRYQRTGMANVIGVGREVQGLRKDGSLFAMELTVCELHHQGRTLFLGMVRDITERRRIEMMKNEFVSTVSHELRTPLTSIAGSLGMITGGVFGPLPAPLQQMIDIAHENSQRLIFMINDLLDMDKLLAGNIQLELQEQPLQPLLQQACAANQGYGVERRVAVRLVAAAPAGLVRVDGPRVLQVLANLISNAIKFSPSDDCVQIEASTQGDWLRVTVTDHGPGIPAAFRARIFTKFAQADSSDTRQRGGTGLGLAISRELIERMGGRIGFDSEEGAGACFYFELPWTPL
jgi:PAS domain S-box-containing protein